MSHLKGLNLPQYSLGIKMKLYLTISSYMYVKLMLFFNFDESKMKINNLRHVSCKNNLR